MLEPLQFTPILKRIRWGGRRLGTLLGKPVGDASDYAESWEISDLGGDPSVVADGQFAGWTLSRLIRERGRELLGRHDGLRQFPLLIKFLDACDNLSVQVHPHDDQARSHDPDANGKTEAWVIIDAQPGSKLYVGLQPAVDRARLELCLRDGAVERCLHAIEPSAGDCIFIPAGTVHAIGAGILLAEVQQASDITFRLYDWGRLDSDGNPRQLHLTEAMACIDFNQGPVDPVRVAAAGAGSPGHRLQHLVACQYFTIERHVATSAFTLEMDDRFHVLMMLAGTGSLEWDGRRLPFELGQSVLVPASSVNVRVAPDAEVTLLDVFLP